MVVSKMTMVGVIPAAGSGKRLLPFTRAVPKEMYPILGKTPLDYALECMRDVGIEKVFIIVGHKKGAIIDYLGDGSRYGLKIVYICQEKQLGLGHALLQVEELIDGAFLTILGDTIITPYAEIQELVNMHFSGDAVSTVLLNEVNDPSDYGVAKINGNKILELKEKPNENDRVKFMRNKKYLAISGAYVLEPEIFDFLNRTSPQTAPGSSGEIQLTDAIESAIQDGKTVNGYILKGNRFDIGNWKTLLEVECELVKCKE